MEYHKIVINYSLCKVEELSEIERTLVEKAKEATNTAYAKYSRFYVGAALLLNNGVIVQGSNQENAAFPSSLCAERTAIFAAQSQYPKKCVKIIAIAARTDDKFLFNPITPCGACRQVILEVEDRYKMPIKVLLYGEKGVYCIDSVKDLLPFSFVDDNLNDKVESSK